jgi:hypothetical protein
MVPLMALVSAASLHRPQFLALFGQGDEAARFVLRRKPDPLPAGYVVGIFSAILLFELLPYAPELWRSWQTNGGRLVPAPARPARVEHTDTL